MRDSVSRRIARKYTCFVRSLSERAHSTCIWRGSELALPEARISVNALSGCRASCQIRSVRGTRTAAALLLLARPFSPRDAIIRSIFY